jgi:nitrite reductase (NO-forming)
VGGPNLQSNFHVIGEHFDRVANWGSLGSWATSTQTIGVPPGDATMAELKLEVPGTFLLVDHAISRVYKGAIGHLVVEGADQPDIYTQL